MSIRLLLALAAALAVQVYADSTTVRLEPVRNAGLVISGDRKLELRFDAAGVSQGAAITSAKLRLQFAELSSAFAIDPKRFSVREQGAAPHISQTISIARPGPVAVDVTAFVSDARKSGRNDLRFEIAGKELNPSARLAAAPQLEVGYSVTTPIARAGGDVLAPDLNAVLDGSHSALNGESNRRLAFSWRIERSAPGSPYKPGQEIGTEPVLRFRPVKPGYYVVRLRITNPDTGEREDTCGVVAGLRAHPRLHIDGALLNAIKSLRNSRDPLWTRFQNWVDTKPTYSDIEGGVNASYLLAYLVTGERKYFDQAWETARKQIYKNGVDRREGRISLLEVYRNDHSAAFLGGQLMADIALLYDWGYDQLTGEQRQDIIEWLNDATEFNYLHNGSAVAYFRNDGAVVTYGIAAASYATLGENPQALERFRWFRRNWDQHLQALDIMGMGGAAGEGNGNGASPTASAFIDLANMIHYASGEDLFASHPWFKARLLYEAFAAYPGYTRGPAPAGSAQRVTEPFVEQSPVNGDGRRGVSWHSNYLRHNGLILARRFAGTEEADAWNWVYRQPEVDRNLNASESFVDLLYYSPRPRLVKPERLSYFDPSMGFVYVRSDWDTPDATWLAFWAGPHIDTHQHLDQGGFELFKRRNLAPMTGSSDEFFQGHRWAWFARTVHSNGMLIGDPKEIFRNFVAGMGCDENGKGTLIASPDNSGDVCIPNDGGQRTMSPFSLAVQTADQFRSYRQVWDVAKVVSFDDSGEAVSVVADLTNAYNSPRYSTPGNVPKVRKVYRRFVYLRKPDVLILTDTVKSTNPAFEKKWLLHAIDTLEVKGAVEQVSPGESLHTGVNEAKIIVDDRHPSDRRQTTFDLRSGYAALLVKTLAPAEFRYRKVGGREPADQPHGDVYRADNNNWNGQHFHTHVKDFWVKDYNEGVVPNHRSLNWLPERPHEVWSPENLPTFGGGFGRWRLEIEPAPAGETEFLNVLKPTLDPAASMPEMRKIETAEILEVELRAGGKAYAVKFRKGNLTAPEITIR